MYRVGVLALLLAGALLFQATLLELIRFYIKPDLILILVIFFALINGARPGVMFGAAAGLLQDLVFGRFLGINLIALSITALVVGHLENKVFKENLLVPILVVFLGSFFHAGLMLALQFLAGVHLPLSAAAHIGFLEAAFNAVLVPLLYRRFWVSNTIGILRGFKRGGV